MRTLEDLKIYKLAMKIGDDVWDMVMQWEHFPKMTLGKQITESSDSIAANIAEGYGRSSTKEAIRFCHISRGSLKETDCFLTKSRNRKLISEEKYNTTNDELQTLGKMLNRYINYLSSK